MAAVQPPGFLNGPPVSTDAAVYREQTKALAGGLAGVCAAGDFAVSQSATPGMSVDIAAGRAIVNGTTVNGAFTVRNDAAITNLAITAADPSNPRIDRVVVEVRPGSPNDDWRVRVVTGTPAGSPSAPAVPDNSLSLATVTVAALASSITNANITSVRTYAGDLAGLPCTQVQMSAAQSIGNNSFTTVAFDTEALDVAGWHDNAVNSSRVTPTIPGWYRVTVHGGWGAGTDYSRQIQAVTRNGSLLYLDDVSIASNGATVKPSTFPLIKANGTTDYLGVQVYQLNSASASRTWQGTLTVELVYATD